MRKYLYLSIIVSIIALQAPFAIAGSDAELDAFKKAIRAKYDLKEKAFKDNDPLQVPLKKP